MRVAAGLIVVLISLLCTSGADASRISREHPRLLGNRGELQAMAKARPQEFQRMAAMAKDPSGDNYTRGISLALVAAINHDPEAAAEAHRMAMKLVNGPIREGHVTFGTDLALAGLIYDLCYEAWSEADRAKYHDYFNKTVDANVNSETHVFHNAWYSYKNWGIGIGAYASYHENPRAPKILETLEEDYRMRAAPALELAGNGGGWAEGYYIHYWLYEWLFFCEVAQRCGGDDYFALAPKFYKQRALASVFEMYPGLSEYNSRRPVPMGDGGGRTFGGDRDKALAARRILVNHYRDDATHQAIHAFNEVTPRVAAGVNAYKDFLWRDTTIPKRDYKMLPLSHFAPGPGYVHARSSWEDDATYFFFKAGDRFTAHQHLDNGHFLIYQHAELLGDGGHYEGFGTAHDVNYHMRTIAHNTILVRDPGEKWPAIRGGKVMGNDGGQHHGWPHHNGASSDPQEWQRNRALYDIADFKAYQAEGAFVYVAADLTRSYSSNKLEKFTRQIIFVRPSTFVVFDQVTTRDPAFDVTSLLHTMKPPRSTPLAWEVNNGAGKLFIETLLPKPAKFDVAFGERLYSYDGQNYPPAQNTGPAPEARLQTSSLASATDHRFLQVLSTGAPTRARLEGSADQLRVRWQENTVQLHPAQIGGSITIDGKNFNLKSTTP